MPRAITLLAVATLLMACRLFTGIVYAPDAPLASLVVKSSPDLATERTATASRPATVDRVVDMEEPQLAYAPAYLAAMRVAPALSVALLAAAAVAGWRSRRGRG